ncbi:hypothetical protein HETIRDRAFT_166150 [Heterobasidion irregulare TC 32-1]|uniref:Uncharacterized protein n=1 Tax=Heterobasidion irregulare (strain TC 32-1) TaxID=747525 RepID=W4KLA1_HETIT|nr:uncharacterized protein HETIRDRAFT_166150 [Heterobasidion irregulare TC 32-1]ETW86633.1 hypothetical protein HETIRDRAFT_166150 [Heterobasidion irregulare TC 32-1]
MIEACPFHTPDTWTSLDLPFQTNQPSHSSRTSHHFNTDLGGIGGDVVTGSCQHS